jgi:hypothetical protein
MSYHSDSASAIPETEIMDFLVTLLPVASLNRLVIEAISSEPLNNRVLSVYIKIIDIVVG